MNNTVRLRELPLLGSNQDSPDPESAASPDVAGDADQADRQLATVSASGPTIPHTIGHPPYFLLARGCEVARPVIYGLVDPDEPERIRYVGRAVSPSSRLAGHVSTSIAPKTAPTKKERWIRALLEVGRYPDMVLLEYVAAGPDREDRERTWILAMRDLGMADTNGTIPLPHNRTWAETLRLAKLSRPAPAWGRR